MVAANLANLEQGGDHQSEKSKVVIKSLVKIKDAAENRHQNKPAPPGYGGAGSSGLWEDRRLSRHYRRTPRGGSNQRGVFRFRVCVRGESPAANVSKRRGSPVRVPMARNRVRLETAQVALPAAAVDFGIAVERLGPFLSSHTQCLCAGNRTGVLLRLVC